MQLQSHDPAVLPARARVQRGLGACHSFLCTGHVNRQTPLSLFCRRGDCIDFFLLWMRSKGAKAISKLVRMCQVHIYLTSLMWLRLGTPDISHLRDVSGKCCFHSCNSLVLLSFMLVPLDQMRLRTEGQPCFPRV